MKFIKTPFSSVSIVDFEQVNVGWLVTQILSSTLINAKLGHSTLINLVLINVACKFS